MFFVGLFLRNKKNGFKYPLFEVVRITHNNK
jgi:hypothetical protein